VADVYRSTPKQELPSRYRNNISLLWIYNKKDGRRTFNGGINK